ncbi:MAG: hypothetical protein AAF458_18750 [Pseudomonadota bacterium]
MHASHSTFVPTPRIRRGHRLVCGIALMLMAPAGFAAGSEAGAPVLAASAGTAQSHSALVLLLGIGIALITLRLTLDQDRRPSRTKAFVARLRDLRQMWVARRLSGQHRN